MTSKEYARACVSEALDKIEEAQGIIASASSSINRVEGLAEECNELGQLYDSIKKKWHWLNQRTAGRELDMDSWWLREKTNPKGQK